MANMYFTEAAKFKPFSYQEMLAPIKDYQDAYNKLEEEYATLDIMAADVAAKLSNNPEDQGLKDLYNQFNTKLQEASNALSTTGLSSSTKRDLAKLKAQYAKDINPINEAYKAYQEDKKYLQKMAIEHPELIITGSADSISEYMNGQSPKLRSINTNELRDEALKLAEQQSLRTYREDPQWTNTADGRLIQRKSYTGLNDIDFANALAEIESNKPINELSNNALLLKQSIDDIIGTVNTEGLTDKELNRVYKSILQGTRAGFKYKEDTKTYEDPMFAHNLALQREGYKHNLNLQRDALKALNDAKKNKKAAISNIGSSTYRAANLGKQSVDKYLMKDETGRYDISDKYKDFLNHQGGDGKIINRDYLVNSNATTNSQKPVRGMSPMYYNPTSDSMYDITKYDDFVSTIKKLGLDPATTNKKQIIDRMISAANDPDAFGRKRASIVTEDTSLIQKYIEKGLKDNKLIEVEGFEKDKDGVMKYAHKDKINYDDLLKNGELNILSLDMDYTTGERTMLIKDAKGNIREFLLPSDVSFEADDQTAIDLNTSYLRDLEKAIENGTIIDDDKTLYKTPFGNLTAHQYREILQDELDFTFASILNYMGKNNINK